MVFGSKSIAFKIIYEPRSLGGKNPGENIFSPQSNISVLLGAEKIFYYPIYSPARKMFFRVNLDLKDLKSPSRKRSEA